MWNVIEVSPTVRPHEERIRASLVAVRRRIAWVPVPNSMRFVLKADRTRTLEMYGYGGFCGDPDLIRLSFNPKNPNMGRHLDKTLERTIAHKYHHRLRAAGSGYGPSSGAPSRRRAWQATSSGNSTTRRRSLGNEPCRSTNSHPGVG